MILVPLPRLVFPTKRPFFGRNKCPVHKTFFEVQPARLFEMRGQGQQYPFYDSRADPILEASVPGLVRSVSRWQVLPGRACAQNPKHSIEHLARFTPRTPALVLAYRIGRQDG